MDQPAVGAETFVLKIYIYSRAAEMETEKLLEDIPGVHRISIDPIEIGKITILGTIHPKRLMKILLNKGINSEQVFEPRINPRDLPNSPGPKRHWETYLDEQSVERLEKLSKLKNLETVDLTKDGMKLKYKKDENVPHLDGKTGSCSKNIDENATHKKGENWVNNYCDFHGNYKSHCSRNQEMYCHGCRTNCGYMAQHEGIPIGIPSQVGPEYIPSAPPVPAEKDTTGFFVFFFLFFIITLIQAALS